LPRLNLGLITSNTHVHLGIRNDTTLVLAFRGTDFPLTAVDWQDSERWCGFLGNLCSDVSYNFIPLRFRETPAGRDDDGLAGSLAHEGFLEAFNNLEQRLLEEIRALLGGEPGKVEICGHSLGGALATLCALWCKEHWPQVDTTCVTLGSPRVGDENFAREFSSRNINCYRLVIPSDPFPTLPDRHTNAIPFQISINNSWKVGWREPAPGNAPAWRHVGKRIVLRPYEDMGNEYEDNDGAPNVGPLYWIRRGWRTVSNLRAHDPLAYATAVQEELEQG
jgi:pimeloyl-ACP methyl ester carboxylesterase